MDKIKIAVVGLKGLPAFGGAARTMEEIINQLNKNYNFTVFEIDTHSDKTYEIPQIKRIIFSGLKNKRFNTFIYYIKCTQYLLFKEEFSLIHTNHLYCGFIIPLLKMKYKVINTVHGIIPQDDIKWNRLDKLLFKVFEYLAVTYSNTVVTVAKPHIKYLEKYRSREYIYIPNGVYPVNLNKAPQKEYIAFAAARIIKLKGLHTLLNSLNLMDYRKKLVVIGDLEQSCDYKKEIKELSEDLNIEFLGLIKDRKKLLNIINNSKYFVFPSFNEGMSNMLLEVASLKTPIICSDIVENKAIFNDSEVLFFKVGDSNDLTEKIFWAENNMNVMNIKAEKAYKKLITDYNWETISKSYRQIYQSLLSH